MRGVALVAVLMLVSAPAMAAPRFAAYEGRDAVHTGNGGTKITKGDVDFWTTGTPPKTFQVLGIYTDKRNDYWVTRLFRGDAIGSKGIAKQIRKLGGDAVIVLNRDTRVAGSTGSTFGGWNWDWGGGSSWGGFSSEIYNNITTALLVVRYLDDSAAAVQPDQQTDPPSALSTALEAIEQPSVSREPAPRAVPSRSAEKKLGPDIYLVRARTGTGYCLKAPANYRGSGTWNRPNVSETLPRCESLAE